MSAAAFALLDRLPGEPARAVLAARGVLEPTLAETAQVRSELGLDAPWPARWARWAGAALTGDLGVSWRTGAPVATALGPRLARTAVLALLAGTLATLLALATAPGAAARRGRGGDRVFLGATALLASTPPFVLATSLLLVGAVGLGWFPVAGDTTPAHYVLPVLTLALVHAAGPARVLRRGLVAEARAPYAVAARARGLSEREVVERHALRGAAGPFVALVGLSLRSLLGGAVLVESVFAVRGTGGYLVEALTARDAPAVLGCVAVLSLASVLVHAAGEAVAARLDPRPPAEETS
ncbi:MAG: ABC transporter permease [Planctomycetes bacterium]|nr:ABC transporter permease [Planctomycetota bacterium]